MGISDPRGRRGGTEIAKVLNGGGQFRVVLGADGALKAESDAPPVTQPLMSDGPEGDDRDTDSQPESHAPDLTPDDVAPPGPRVGFDGRPLAGREGLTGGSVIGGDSGAMAAGLGPGGAGC